MFRKIIFSLVLLMLSNTGFSLISKAEWVSRCKNSYGEEEYTFDVIRKYLGDWGKASCSQAYDRMRGVKVFSPLYIENIRNITPLAGFTNLKEIIIPDNKIEDISPLVGLTNLTYINLQNNQISNLRPLANLTNLRSIILSYNRVSDLRFLSGLMKLESIHLEGNQIADLSPLVGLKNLQQLRLGKNQISDLTPLDRVTSLEWLFINENQISDFSHVNHVLKVWGKDEQTATTISIASAATSISNASQISKKKDQTSPFYEKLMQKTSDTITFLKKADDLSELIEDVHQMKFYYSFIMYSYRTGVLDLDQRNGYIQNGLEEAKKYTGGDEQWAIFRLILDKSTEDAVIDRGQEIRLSHRGLLNNIEQAKFITDLQQAVKVNTTAIKGLEGDIKALHKNLFTVNRSLNKVKKGLQKKMEIESSVGFMGAVLNAVSFGFAGSALQAASAISMSDIVDFSDFTHIQEIAENAGFGDAFSQVQDTVGETDLAGAFGIGLSSAEDSSEDNLEKAVNEKSTLIVIAAIAAKIEYSQNEQSTGPTSIPTQVFPSSQKSTVSSLSGYDSGFESDDEDDYPLHAAIKYGDLELLNEELDNSANVRKIDKKGRSPADYAAIKGEDKMMKLIVDMGGNYKIGSKAKMRKICRDRLKQNK